MFLLSKETRDPEMKGHSALCLMLCSSDVHTRNSECLSVFSLRFQFIFVWRCCLAHEIHCRSSALDSKAKIKHLTHWILWSQLSQSRCWAPFRAMKHLLWHHRWTFFTADILTCRSRWNTGGGDNINDGSSVPVSDSREAAFTESGCARTGAPTISRQIT